MILSAYILPWVNNHASGLNLGAYDLAELSSLVPALDTSLYLRIQLFNICLLIGLFSHRSRFSAQWWLANLTILTLTFAQLPPFEFINNLSNPNYQQQFILAILSLASCLLILVNMNTKVRTVVMLIICGVSIGSAIVGLTLAQDWMLRFSLMAQITPAIVLFIISYIGLGIFILLKQKHGRKFLPC